MRQTKLFLTDQKLPTLAGVLASYPAAEIVKYSPQKRCTVRIVREGKVYYVKVYPSKFVKRQRGEGIDETGRVFWSLSQSGVLNFRVPRPVGWDGATQTVWNAELPGTAAIEKLKSPKGEEIAFNIGRAVALIALSGIVPRRVFDYPNQLTDAAEFAEITNRRFPELKSVVEPLLTSFKRPELPIRKLTPIHGDMHIDQWLTDRNRLGLLDFEDFALGHPERDLAFFMVQLEAEYGRELEHKMINGHFLAGYRSEGSSPNEKLLNIYSAHKWFSKASKAANKTDAEELLGRSRKCLESFSDNPQ